MEAKLAQSFSKRTIFVTIGAALATLLVFAGVFFGPALVQCSSSQEGFATCFSNNLAGRGILPSDQDKDRLAASGNGADQGVTDAGKGEGQATVAPDALPPENQDKNTSPLIGARVEADGSSVLVGTATPNAEINLFANGKFWGKTTTDASGDWVFIPDQPIAPGATEITIGTPGPKGEVDVKDQTLIVYVQKDLKSEPLVVASRIGQASKVLQGLEVKDPALFSASPGNDQRLEVAALEDKSQPAATPETSTTETASTETTEVPVPETVEAAVPPISADNNNAQTETVPVAAPDAATTKDATTDAATNDQANAANEQTAPVSKTEPASNTGADQNKTPADAQNAATPNADAQNTPSQDQNTQPQDNGAPVAATKDEAPIVVANIPPKQLVVPPEEKIIPPSIDAVEIDGGRSFIAGAGQNGAIVKLYVDGVLVGDSEVKGGRWLVEAGNVLTKPSQRLRADMLIASTGKVSAQTEINFVVERPKTSEPAAAPKPDFILPAENLAPAVLPTKAPKFVVAKAEPVAPKPDFILPAENLAPAILPTKAPAFVSNIPTSRAVVVGRPKDQRFASGKVIIRRGDNLWTIARRVYGFGIRYIAIFEANKNQIRDPDLIYPGQVFDLPEDKQAANNQGQ